MSEEVQTPDAGVEHEAVLGSGETVTYEYDETGAIVGWHKN